jgi:hypothetical protein
MRGLNKRSLCNAIAKLYFSRKNLSQARTMEITTLCNVHVCLKRRIATVLQRQCYGSGMFFRIPDPGTDFFSSRIRIKEFKYFNLKNGF